MTKEEAFEILEAQFLGLEAAPAITDLGDFEFIDQELIARQQEIGRKALEKAARRKALRLIKRASDPAAPAQVAIKAAEARRRYVVH